MAKQPKGTTSQTIDQTTAIDPYAPARPSIDRAIGAADQAFQQGPADWFPGGTYAGMGQGSRDAITNLRNVAGQPSAADQYLTGMAQGGQQNPFLSQLLDTGSQRIADRVKAAYASSGRYGSEDFTDALTRGIAEYQTPLQYAAYEGDQGRRIGAANAIDQSRFTGSNQLLLAGGLEDASAQAQRDADIARHLWENGQGAQSNLSQYIQNLMGASGQFGSQTTTGNNTTREPVTPFLNILKAISAGVGAFAG